MKKRLDFVVIYFWLFLLLCAGLGTLIFADREERVSESEKRMLAAFPDTSAESVFSGKFSSGFESFLSDGIFLRDSVAGASKAALGLFSAASYEDTMLLSSISMADEISGGTAAQDTAAPAEGSPAQESGGQSAAQAPGSDASGGYGLYMLCPDGSEELLADVSELRVGMVANVLNEYKGALSEDGQVFYSCIPVTSYRDVVVKSGKYTGWHENFEDAFNSLLLPGVHMVSAPNVLNDHLMDEPLFFQADHHWTPLAAYYLIERMMQTQGVPVVPYDEYDYLVSGFYNIQGLGDPMDLMYPLLPAHGNVMRSGTEGEDAPIIVYNNESYTAYLAGGNHVWTKYTTGFDTGRKALVIGDSFTTAFIPYLMPYYDEVHRADPRYYNSALNGGTVSELIAQYGIDDVYIILSYDNGIDSDMSSKTLEYLLYG